MRLGRAYLLVAAFIFTFALSATAQMQLRQVPLYFEENRGQFPADVKFLSRGAGYTLALSRTSATLNLGQDAVVVKFAGGRVPTAILGQSPLESRTNYLIGTPSHWKRDLPHYGEVRYESLYDGIDLVYHSRNAELEYDFIIRPGADPSRIAIAFSHAHVNVDPEGDLIIKTDAHEFRQRRPVAYQEGAGGRQQVAVDYLTLSGNRVGFRFGRYDHTRQLVIDPIVVFSSYVGGTGWESGYDIATDSAGNAYITGISASTNYPMMNPIQSSNRGKQDIVVTKVSPFGKLIYSTYIGGSDDDRAYKIAVNSSGEAFVMGGSYSSDFPAFQSIHPGWFPMFALKLNAAGNSIVWATPMYQFTILAIALDSASNVYLGGYDLDVNAQIMKLDPNGNPLSTKTFGYGYIYGMAVDNASNLIAVGHASDHFRVVNAAQPQNAGGWDGFVMKLDPAGAVVFSTYLGGSDYDRPDGVAVDAAQNIYVAGITVSPDFPTLHALQSTMRGQSDAFIAKYNATGVLQYSTYLGGSQNEYAPAIAVDSEGNASVTGTTSSFDFPVINAVQSTFAGVGDAFISKLNASGEALLFSTYFGGADYDEAHGIGLDRSGGIYIAGYTTSENLSTIGAFQPTYRTYGDGFIVKVDTAFSRVEQNSSQVQYTGEWVTHSTPQTGNSGGSAVLAALAGSRATFMFNGTAAHWVGYKDEWAGIANVYVDGVFKMTVDTYASPAQRQAIVYSITELDPGTHTLTVEVTGRRSTASQGNWIWVDAFDYANTAGGNTPTPDFSLGVTPTSASVVQGGTTTYTVSVTPSNGFSGTVSLSATGYGSGTSGTFTPATVSPSGSSTLTVTASSTAQTGPVTLTVTGTSGSLSHTATAILNVNASTGGGGGTGTWSRVEQTNTTAVQFNGDWAVNSSPNHSGGTAKLTFADSVTFTFTGTESRWIGFSDPWSGIANVYVDGVLKSSVDTYSATEKYQSVLYTITGLSSGTHTLKIQATGQHSASAKSSWVWIDAFDYLSGGGSPGIPDFTLTASPSSASVAQGGAATHTISVSAMNGFSGMVSLAATGLGAGATASFNPASIMGSGSSTLTISTTSAAQTGSFTVAITGTSGGITHSTSVSFNVTAAGTTPTWNRIDDKNAAVQFSSDWLTNSNPNHSGGSAHLTLGNSVTFTFTGTGARWIGFSDPWSGIANVYVDGVFKGTIDTYSATDKYQVVEYVTTGLASGTHTLKIVAAGQHSAQAQSSWVWVDAFDYSN